MFTDGCGKPILGNHRIHSQVAHEFSTRRGYFSANLKNCLRTNAKTQRRRDAGEILPTTFASLRPRDFAFNASLRILHPPKLFPNDTGQPFAFNKTLLHLRHQSRVFLGEGFGVFFDVFRADVAAGGEDVAVLGGTKKRCQEPFSGFLGLPCGRRVLSSPRRATICSVQAGSPNGLPRFTLRRKAANSASD